MKAWIVKNLIATLLLPVAIGATLAVGQEISAGTVLSEEGYYLLLGAAGYGLFHLFLFRPMVVYVFGHETAHVLATWVCGGKVTSFKVTAAGGQVKTSKTNFFIELAPYYLPTYALFVSAAWPLLLLAFDLRQYEPVFFAALGAAVFFHLVMTVEILRARQPDILNAGPFFAFTTIYLVNVLILGALLSFFLAGNSIPIFGRTLYDLSREIYLAVFRQLFNL